MAATHDFDRLLEVCRVIRMGYSVVGVDSGGRAPDRLFGVIRVPSRYLPVIVFAFYMLLAPGSPWILHSAAAVASYLVASRSASFTPSQEAYHRLEASPAFSPLTRARGFVSVHQDRAFLPIFRRSIITEDDNGSPSSDQEFPGQGRRLGGTT
ncbi:hypothetical protein INT43_006433 [Umbelopsis isabellina]|uniref:Uncharacterized protein n=1 Tax=Mortierella isabellina TaxID=91625 RepID=A0A8H7UIX6_MORIS|nr:hypothetical protein INT43_006433 [Umbelopsis isabellina]